MIADLASNIEPGEVLGSTSVVAAYSVGQQTAIGAFSLALGFWR